MKVKILKSIASPSYAYAAGQEVEVSSERAEEFIQFGIAVPAGTQTATAKTPAETTSTRKGRGRNADDA